MLNSEIQIRAKLHISINLNDDLLIDISLIINCVSFQIHTILVTPDLIIGKL